MADATQLVVSCPNCGVVHAELESSTLPPGFVEQFLPCRKCGHELGHVAATLPTLRVSTELGMRAKSSKLPGKKKPAIEARAEPATEKSTGRRVFHERKIDRARDQYVERVTDKKSGEILHETDEPLSKHLGHGSDKKNRNAKGE